MSQKGGKEESAPAPPLKEEPRPQSPDFERRLEAYQLSEDLCVAPDPPLALDPMASSSRRAPGLQSPVEYLSLRHYDDQRMEQLQKQLIFVAKTVGAPLLQGVSSCVLTCAHFGPRAMPLSQYDLLCPCGDANQIDTRRALSQVSSGDDNEDRKRLKEKLKEALERDRRSRLRRIMSERQRWAEYIFGICKPDRRNGKRGNRFAVSLELDPGCCL